MTNAEFACGYMKYSVLYPKSYPYIKHMIKKLQTKILVWPCLLTPMTLMTALTRSCIDTWQLKNLKDVLAYIYPGHFCYFTQAMILDGRWVAFIFSFLHFWIVTDQGCLLIKSNCPSTLQDSPQVIAHWQWPFNDEWRTTERWTWPVDMSMAPDSRLKCTLLNIKLSYNYK